MQIDQPIDGEMDFEGDELVDAAEAMMDMMRQMVALQNQQLQMMGYIAQALAAMNGPKRVVRDKDGKVVGVEPVQ